MLFYFCHYCNGLILIVRTCICSYILHHHHPYTSLEWPLVGVEMSKSILPLWVERWGSVRVLLTQTYMFLSVLEPRYLFRTMPLPCSIDLLAFITACDPSRRWWSLIPNVLMFSIIRANDWCFIPADSATRKHAVSLVISQWAMWIMSGTRRRVNATSRQLMYAALIVVSVVLTAHWLSDKLGNLSEIMQA